MKKWLLLFAALSVVGCSTPRPNARTNYAPPSSNVIAAHISGAQEQAGKTHRSIAAATAQAKSAKERLQVLKKAVASQAPVLVLAEQIEGDVDILTTLLGEATNSNLLLQDHLTAAEKSRIELQQQVDTQTVQLNTANTERNAAITQGALDKRNAHRFKGFIIALAMLSVVSILFGIFRGLAFVPPLLYATLGAPAAVGIFLFFWLGSG